jgi:Uma2 family endonuclease
MHATARKLITAEEFFLMPESRWCELVYGELVPMAPVGESHGFRAGRVYLALELFCERTSAGRVLIETGYRLSLDPDLVRAPDVSFIRRDRIQGPPADGYREGPPDLAVEVLSPGDTATEINEKINEYLDFGTTEVWIVDPRQKQVQVHRKGGAVTLRGDDVLEGQGPLAGFSVPVSRFFID